MSGVTAPNIGVLSSDCGSTFHPLMNAQREVAEGSDGEGAVPASFSASDCLRISVTQTPHQKNAGTGRVCQKETFTSALLPALNERKLGFLDL